MTRTLRDALEALGILAGIALFAVVMILIVVAPAFVGDQARLVQTTKGRAG